MYCSKPAGGHRSEPVDQRIQLVVAVSRDGAPSDTGRGPRFPGVTIRGIAVVV